MRIITTTKKTGQAMTAVLAVISGRPVPQMAIPNDDGARTPEQ
jgi:hypothetical protein